MAVPSTITDLSTTANSNSPAGSEVPSSGNGPDEYIRALGSIVRVMRAKGSDVASATTTDLGAATTGDFVHVTGTTTITGLGTIAAGIKKVVTFDGALTLTHNGTSLILPGAANITTAAGDVAEFISEGSGNWRCTGYTFAGGQGNVTGASSSVDSEIVLFSGTGGKTIKRASTTGILKGASGVLSAASAGTDYVAPGAYTGSGLTMATARLLGRTTASTGAAEEISIGSGLTLSSGTLSGSGLTIGTPAATTSGTTVNLSDIGSGAKSVTVSFNGVSTNGSNSILVQVGPSGGVVTTGYVSTAFWCNSGGAGSTSETSTAGLLVGRNFAAGDVINGNLRMTLENSSTNTWTVNGVINGQSSGGISFFAGKIALAGELIKVRLTTVGGTDTFDAGEANNSYQ